MLLNTRLCILRQEFKNEGYTDAQIKGIELSEGDGNLENRIDNLEMEKSYWAD